MYAIFSNSFTAAFKNELWGIQLNLPPCLKCVAKDLT